MRYDEGYASLLKLSGSSNQNITRYMLEGNFALAVFDLGI